MNTKDVQVMIYPDGRLNAKNAARYLGISTQTLANFRCHGKGPQYVKRGLIFYFKKDLDQWLQEGMRKTEFQPEILTEHT